jgi:UDP-N-acetylmuramoyl-tripeptide--D-alanyl-D-alanine ligase
VRRWNARWRVCDVDGIGVTPAVVQHGGDLGWAVAGACVLATALGGIRWLRVAQREHYLPDSSSRFALRWWGSSPVNRTAALAALAALVVSARWPVAAVTCAVVVALGPLGLTLRGRTSPLRWTRRLRTLAAVWAVLQGAIVVAGALSGFAGLFGAAGAVLAPVLVDVACFVTAPLEDALASRYVRTARRRIRRVRPKVVAITGSYGKTSTKGYVAHLLAGSMAVVASPASFNNRAGLARAVNENLTEGTDAFVAEMGTYGPGEIAQLCEWLPPDVAVITAIGPVHLERFGTEEKIVRAKSEILAGAPVCVLQVDDPRLAQVADRTESSGKRVLRASGGTRPDADVLVVEANTGLEVKVRGATVCAGISVRARPGNVACAVAVAIALGVPTDEISARLSSLPVAAHRLDPVVTAEGVTVLDDTYNSNPAGVRAALEELKSLGAQARRRVVVTPGMVELGASQRVENARFAEQVSEVATDFVVVGRTNRRQLLEGFRRSPSADGRSPLVFAKREQAVEWVRSELGAGDVVLYENDLPDHYP